MRAYIIEYRVWDRAERHWISKISQEGYETIEKAQEYIESRPSNPVRCANMYYQTELLEEYFIHDIRIV